MDNSRSQQKSLYYRGAENGLSLGLLFVVIFAMYVMSEKTPIFSTLTLLAAMLVPVYSYMTLRRTIRQEAGSTIFAALWMQGIVSFACAGAIMCVVVWTYMKYFDPMLLIRQVDYVLETSDRNPALGGSDMVETLRQIREFKMIPGPTDVARQILMMAVFSGSCLSLITSAIVKSTYRTEAKL